MYWGALGGGGREHRGIPALPQEEPGSGLSTCPPLPTPHTPGEHRSEGKQLHSHQGGFFFCLFSSEILLLNQMVFDLFPLLSAAGPRSLPGRRRCPHRERTAEGALGRALRANDQPRGPRGLREVAEP